MLPANHPSCQLAFHSHNENEAELVDAVQIIYSHMSTTFPVGCAHRESVATYNSLFLSNK